MNQVSNAIKIKVEPASYDYWDFYVYKEVGDSKIIVGFIKEFEDKTAQFLVAATGATYGYGFKSVEEVLDFVKSGRW